GVGPARSRGRRPTFAPPLPPRAAHVGGSDEPWLRSGARVRAFRPSPLVGIRPTGAGRAHGRARAEWRRVWSCGRPSPFRRGEVDDVARRRWSARLRTRRKHLAAFWKRVLG